MYAIRSYYGLFIIAMITAAGIAFAQNADVTVTVTGVAAGKAPIYVALYDRNNFV